MFLIQILLPLCDNSGASFSHLQYEQVRDELTELFGGVTAYLRSPAQGLWKESGALAVQDDIVIYEVMTENLDREWWRKYREKLTSDFRQDLLIVRVNEVQLL
jgi:hypothetical protein